MIEFIKSKFSSMVGFLFILTIIGFCVLGVFIGDGQNSYKGFDYTKGIIFGVIGLGVGYVIGIVVFGLIATVLQICDNTEEILKKDKKNQYSQQNTNSTSKNTSPSVVLSGDYKVCKKCGEKCAPNLINCKSCGEYL